MIAFLKRRWVLLSCAIVLIGCSGINYYKLISGPRALWVFSVGIDEGAFEWHQYAVDAEKWPHWRHFFSDIPPSQLEFHPLTLGGNLRVDRVNWIFRVTEVTIPLWLPLAAVLGWLVIRELRFREKRAKAADTIAP